VLPLELSRDILRELQAARPAGFETEVFAYGRMPLAFSRALYRAPPQPAQGRLPVRCLDDATASRCRRGNTRRS